MKTGRIGVVLILTIISMGFGQEKYPGKCKTPEERAYWDAVMKETNPFLVPKEESDIVWGRLHKFIVFELKAEIEREDAFTISKKWGNDRVTGRSHGQRLDISRIDVGNGEVEITIKGNPGVNQGVLHIKRNTKENEQMIAHYARTGEFLKKLFHF